MPANTPNRGYTYATSDDANDLALISQRLAEQVDADVQGVVTDRDKGLSVLSSPIIGGGASSVTVGNGYYGMRYKKQGRRVKCYASFSRGSTTSFPASGSIFLPVPFPIADMGNGALLLPLGTFRGATTSLAYHGEVVFSATFSSNAVYLLKTYQTSGTGWFDTYLGSADLGATGAHLACSFEYETTA